MEISKNDCFFLKIIQTNHTRTYSSKTQKNSNNLINNSFLFDDKPFDIEDIMLVSDKVTSLFNLLKQQSTSPILTFLFTINRLKDRSLIHKHLDFLNLIHFTEILDENI